MLTGKRDVPPFAETVTHSVEVLLPARFEFHLLPSPTPYALNPATEDSSALLNYTVFLDCHLGIDEMRLVRWEFWDAISGRQFPPLAPPSCMAAPSTQ